MKQQNRLAGVDLFRGIAAFGVTLLHSRGGTSAAPDPLSAWLITASSFAVPFFLAASFYFGLNRFYIKGKTLNIKDRFQRLMIPYAFWSIVYVFFRVSKGLIIGNSKEAMAVISDPIAIIFMGSAAVQLYFVPLLFFGYFSIKLIEFIENKRIKPSTKNGVLIVGAIASIVAYQMLIATGNNFVVGNNYAFINLTDRIGWLSQEDPIIRVILVIIAYIIRCLPYVLIAAVFAKNNASNSPLFCNTKSVLFISIILLIASTFSHLIGFASVRELMQGYSSLLLAIALSTYMAENAIIFNVGACSFGIYLLHHLVIEIFEFVVGKVSPSLIEPISAATILITASFSFFMSWAIVNLFRKHPIASRFI